MKILRRISLAGILEKLGLPVAKNVSLPLRPSAAESPIEAGIQKNIFVFADPRAYYPRTYGSESATLWTSNEEMDDIMKTV